MAMIQVVSLHQYCSMIVFALCVHAISTQDLLRAYLGMYVLVHVCVYTCVHVFVQCLFCLSSMWPFRHCGCLSPHHVTSSTCHVTWCACHVALCVCQ